MEKCLKYLLLTISTWIPVPLSIKVYRCLPMEGVFTSQSVCPGFCPSIKSGSQDLGEELLKETINIDNTNSSMYFQYDPMLKMYQVLEVILDF